MCATCHQPDGQGVGDVFPPLAGSETLMDKERAIGIVLAGLSGPLVVKGRTFDGVMPSLAHLADREIADVLTFARNSFGNRGEAVHEAEVALVRETLDGVRSAEAP